MSIKKRLLLLAVISVVFVFGFSAKAMTETEKQILINQIKAQIQSLLQQVAELRAKEGVGQNVSSTSCHTFGKIMNVGNSGQEVAYLQAFLQREGFAILSNEISNRKYGLSTKSAVSAFQKKYASVILTPNGLTQPTGRVARATLSALNGLYACASIGSTGKPGVNFISPINYLYKSTGYNDIETSLPESTITENTIITLSQQASKKVNISGTIRLNNGDSLIRVVLVDSNNNEYVVLEASSSFYDVGQDIKITDACEETCAFAAPITPVKLKIKVQNASILISNVGLIAKNKSSDSKKNIASIIGSAISSLVGVDTSTETNYMVALEQARDIKLKKVQTMIAKNNLEWKAGKTTVSNLSYEEKKRLLLIPQDQDLPNLDGVEYYVGGIFDFSESKKVSSVSSVSTGVASMEPVTASKVIATSSGIPNHVDYRNYNGKNFMTSVKDQGIAGNCFAFSYVGAMEAQINFSLGKNLNINLSEQQLPDCEKYDSDYANPEMQKVLGFYTSTTTPSQAFFSGITDEGCDPYIERDLRDGDGNIFDSACYEPNICSDYNDRYWKISDFILYGYAMPYWYAGAGLDQKFVKINNADDLRKIIAEKGPLASGIFSWRHGMVLMGYDVDQDYWIFKNSWGAGWGDHGYFKGRGPVSRVGGDGAVNKLFLGPFSPPINSRYWPSFGTACEYKEECVDAGKSSKYVITDWNCKRTTVDLKNKVTEFFNPVCTQSGTNKNRVNPSCVVDLQCVEWSKCVLAENSEYSGMEEVKKWYGKTIESRFCPDVNYCQENTVEIRECVLDGKGPGGSGGNGTGGGTTNCGVASACESKITGCTPKYMWFSAPGTDICTPGISVMAISYDVNGCGMIPDNPASPKNPRLSNGAQTVTCPPSGHLNGSYLCIPKTCVWMDGDKTGQSCGAIDDGCGGIVNCGTCASGLVCISGKCVLKQSCVPKTCSQLGKTCGIADDGCGGTVNCGTCCVPKTCAELGFDCGVQSNGCGGTVNCGTCASGSACVSGKCATGCGTQICATLGRECGWVRDNCGNYVGCQYNSSLALGACPAGNTCSATGKCIVQTVINPPPTGTIRCYNDNNCSNNGALDGFITGQDVCDSAGLKLYSGYETNKCLFPGTTNSYCAKVITSELFQDCTKILGSVGKCADGKCY